MGKGRGNTPGSLQPPLSPGGGSSCRVPVHGAGLSGQITHWEGALLRCQLLTSPLSLPWRLPPGTAALTAVGLEWQDGPRSGSTSFCARAKAAGPAGHAGRG